LPCKYNCLGKIALLIGSISLLRKRGRSFGPFLGFLLLTQGLNIHPLSLQLLSTSRSSGKRKVDGLVDGVRLILREQRIDPKQRPIALLRNHTKSLFRERGSRFVICVCVRGIGFRGKRIRLLICTLLS